MDSVELREFTVQHRLVPVCLGEKVDKGQEDKMNLKEYFEIRNGTGILATSDKDGMVDAAICSRPYVFDDGTVAFLMRDRLSYHNIQSNPYATYLFIEQGSDCLGIRLYLKKIKEDNDPVLIHRMTRPDITHEEDEARGPKYLVHFRVEKALQLINGEEAGIKIKDY